MKDTQVTLFRSRNFRLLFGSTAASAIGDWLDFVAILVLVSVVWDEGAFGLAAVSVAIGLPNLVAPLVGVYVDRSSPRLVMVTADIGRAVITAAMVFSSGLWMLVGLLALRSAFSTSFVPAEQTVIKQAVPEGSLVSANALIQTVVQGFKVVGPATGACSSPSPNRPRSSRSTP